MKKLIENGSFEMGDTATKMQQGKLPSPWQTRDGGADAYSSDGSWGLASNFMGNFLPNQSAADAIGWVAAGAALGEFFWQKLPNPLVPSKTYQLSAELLQSERSDLHHPGSYKVSLAKSIDNGGVRQGEAFLGEFSTGTSGSGQWMPTSLVFTTPPNANELGFIMFTATGEFGDSYPGIDKLKLTRLLGADTAGSPADEVVALLNQFRTRFAEASIVIGAIPADGPGIIIPIAGGPPTKGPPPRPGEKDILSGLLLHQSAGKLTDRTARIGMQREALRIISNAVHELNAELNKTSDQESKSPRP